MKICSICKEPKDYRDFTKDATTNDKYRPSCKVCDKDKREHKKDIKANNLENDNF